MLKTQLKYKEYIDKNVRPPQKRVSDKVTEGLRAAKKKKGEEKLILSSEITSWIHDSIHSVDEHTGMLPEEICSEQQEPVDSMAVLCPIAHKLTAQNAIPRLTSADTNTASFRFLDTVKSFESTRTGTPSLKRSSTPNRANPFSAIKAKLEILWHQRKAELAKEEGKYQEAYENLEVAVDFHLSQESVNRPATRNTRSAGTPTTATSGSQKYLDTALSDENIPMDVFDLLNTIKDDYVTFDAGSASKAAKVQRWYRKHLAAKAVAQCKLASYFRGYLVRRDIWHVRDLYLQCVKRVQGMYKRRHALRNKCSSQLWKWYQRCKEIKFWTGELMRYRAAVRIQCAARQKMARRALQREQQIRRIMVKFQKFARGYLSRYHQYIPLERAHAVVYFAAQTIQCFARRIIAKRNCYITLINVIKQEEKRKVKENNLIRRIVKVDNGRNNFYMKTTAGKQHFASEVHNYKVQMQYFKEAEKSMSEREILDYKVKQVFDLFDSEGFNRVQRKDLPKLLEELTIPALDTTKRKVRQYIDIGEGDEGYIDLKSFQEWYSFEGSQLHGPDAPKQAKQPSGVKMKTGRGRGGKGGLGKMGGLSLNQNPQYLEQRRYTRALRGLTAREYAERAMLRHRTAYSVQEVIFDGFSRHSPKYSCCQCLASFSMFADYQSHFHETTGICGVTQKRGFFFKDYWVGMNWTFQRLVEMEVMRLNLEAAYVKYKQDLQGYEYWISSTSEAVRGRNRRERDTLANDYAVQLSEATFVRPLLDSVLSNDLMDPFDNNHFPAVLVYVIAAHTGTKLPGDCVYFGEWPIVRVRDWVSSQLEFIETDSRFKVDVKKRKKAELLGTVRMHTARYMAETKRAALLALMSFRLKKPRLLCDLSDELLDSKKLGFLTSREYIKMQLKLATEVQRTSEEVIRMSVEHTPFLMRVFGYSRRGHKGPQIVPSVEPETDGPDEGRNEKTNYRIMPAIEMENHYKEVHKLAQSRASVRLASTVGKMQVHRLKALLWAKRKRLSDPDEVCGKGPVDLDATRNVANGEEPSRELSTMLLKASHRGVKDLYFPRLFDHSKPRKNMQQQIFREAECKADLKYFLDMYSTFRGDIDIRDVSMLLGMLGISTKLGVRDEIVSQLDPEGFGIIEHSDMVTWVLSGRYKAYKSAIQSFAAVMMNLGNISQFKLYSSHARTAILLNTRMSTRMEEELVGLCIGAASDASLMGSPATSIDAGGKLCPETGQPEMGADRRPLEEQSAEAVAVEGAGSSSARARTRRSSKVLIADARRAQALRTNKFEEIATEFQNLADLEARNEKAELRLLIRIEEEDAERLCKEQLRSTWDGRKALRRERMLLQEGDKVIAAYGQCLESSAAVPKALNRRRKYLKKRENMTSLSALRWHDYLMSYDGENQMRRQHVLQERVRMQATNRNVSIPQSRDISRPQSREAGRPQSREMIAAYPQGMNMSRPVSPPGPLNAANRRNRSSSPGNGSLRPFSANSFRSVQSQDDFPVGYADNFGWEWLLKTLVQSFDTDCSGTFDENEVRLLLSTARCTLPLKKLLYSFPEVDDGTATLHDVTHHLVSRVGFKKGSLPKRVCRRLVTLGLGQGSRNGGVIRISKLPNHLNASKLLILSARQNAKEEAEVATASAGAGSGVDAASDAGVKIGKKGEGNVSVRNARSIRNSRPNSPKSPGRPRTPKSQKSHVGDDILTENTRITRTQLIAMRQVTLFLETSLGKLRLADIKKDTKYLWDSIVASDGASQYTLQSLITYTMSLHEESEGRLLVTELPYIVQYLIKVWGLKPSSSVQVIAAKLQYIKRSSDVCIVDAEDTFDLLFDIFRLMGTEEQQSAQYPSEEHIGATGSSPVHGDAPFQPSKAQTSFNSGLSKRLKRRRSKFALADYFKIDAEYKLRAVSRQQALFLAFPNIIPKDAAAEHFGADGAELLLREQEKSFHDTFYRCAVLSLSDMVAKNEDYMEGNALMAEMPPEGPVGILPLLVLANGFSCDDIVKSDLHTLLEIDQFAGYIKCHQISVAEALDTAVKYRKTKLNVFKRIDRLSKYYSPFADESDYYRSFAALNSKRDEIMADAQKFVKELRTGMSIGLEESHEN